MPGRLDPSTPAPAGDMPAFGRTADAAIRGTAGWLRLDGATALAGACIAYASTDANWWLFAALFLLSDLTMAGCAAGPRMGAIAYNLSYFYTFPAALLGLGFGFCAPALVPVALVWTAHIGFDRMLGFDLKGYAGFGYSHLGSK